jgi:hypothetical protein
MRGIITVQIPDELFAGFVQWIRDFDSAHAGCQINMFAETEHNADAMKKIFEGIKPGFPFVGELKLKERP